MNLPGLIKRELISEHGDYVTIRETWDVNVPGCPIVVIRPDGGALQVNSVERTTRMKRAEWDFGGDA